jgi:multidrug/hemolysin transport system ATP-binding protein
MKNIIEIKNLNKSFKEVKAVNDLSFKIKEGELFAFLGVNGAGKSTTINIMCGQLEKDSGKVYINGKDIDFELDDIKKDIGVVFQNSVLDQQLTVYENLECRGSLYNILGDSIKKRIDELSELLEFKDFLYRSVNKLSGGQRRRIDIARALLHKPKILILDEPTTGLDPQTRKTLWEVISSLQKTENMTVLLTTHYMEEAVDANYVVIIDEGKICSQGTPIELKNQYTRDYITFYNMNEEDIKKLNLEYEKISNGYRIYVEDTNKAKNLILNNPDLFNDFEITKGKMDDVFILSTGKNLKN